MKTVVRHVGPLLVVAITVGWSLTLSRRTVAAQTASRVTVPDGWIEPGNGGRLPQEMTFRNPQGRVGVLMASGAVDTTNHLFFTPIGTNGRACVTCHQPSDGMSISAATLRERWRLTGGRDPVFAAIDGSKRVHSEAARL